MAGEDSVALVEELYRRADGESFLDRTLSVDMHSYLPDDILAKVDIAGMGNALETRAPFLDHRLLEFAAACPPALKLRGTTGKYLLKKALAPYLPRQILHRRKMGFGMPVAEWFRGELGEHGRRPAALAARPAARLFPPRRGRAAPRRAPPLPRRPRLPPLGAALPRALVPGVRATAAVPAASAIDFFHKTLYNVKT